ncbi:iron-sulfur cluster assembly scaffold protein [Nitratiruptor sp. YY09-18]|uniref:iron-sulfur cluster assembly scaffold protein n=1 Tax=Nitratiruptor sp. YY09-18 TaxID=2724901 RepID=UPI0019160321|nr:iron-sulfur cluster assembly scaffold protein [Nitratiruptor sp. YY09-18]BCD67713.1 nitrogen fixation protein NifU and related proteins [Nitratiruptor sp. YY09-18]
MQQTPPIDPQLLELMINPPNYGEMQDYDAKGYGKNQQTGEMVVIYLKIDPVSKIIKDIKWQTNGCGTTVVSGGLFSKEYKNKTLQHGIDFTNEVFEKIKDNPPPDAACGEVVARAFMAAVKDYEARQKGIEKDHYEYVTLSCPTPEEQS